MAASAVLAMRGVETWSTFGRGTLMDERKSQSLRPGACRRASRSIDIATSITSRSIVA